MSERSPVELGAFDHHHTDLLELRATYDRLYGGCPVGHTAAYGGYYLLGGHQEVRAAAGDWRTFSSAGGTSLPHRPFRVAAIEFDPPHHAYWRDLYKEVINLATYRSFEERVENHVRRLVDAFAARGEADLVEELTEPLPVITICEVIGISDPARARAARAIALDLYRKQGDPPALREALAGFSAFALEEINERRREPRDDFLTRLGTQPVAGVDGEVALMDDQAIVNLLIGFLVAGHHSTASAMASLLFHLARHSQLRDRLVADPGALPRAIEETVRLDTPLHAFFRQTTREVEVAGVALPAGAEVMLNYAAANRDPSAFADPSDFVLDRPRQNHLGFGHGIHSCVGAQLARLELRLAVGHVLRRLPDLRLASPEPTHRVWSGGSLAMIDQLEVRFTPA